LSQKCKPSYLVAAALEERNYPTIRQHFIDLVLIAACAAVQPIGHGGVGFEFLGTDEIQGDRPSID